MQIHCKKIPHLLPLLGLFALSACESIPEIETVDTTPITIPVDPAPIISTSPISNPKKELVELTQTRLQNLGYKVGFIDGLWGKRSEQAMVKFESDNGLISAGGQLSDLNLEVLSRLSPSSVQRKQIKSVVIKPPTKTLTEQVDKTKNPKTPQLIILEKDYLLLSKANPYSSVIKKLDAGAGIYVSPIQDTGWFKIETLDDNHGYINDGVK